jgi:hypothetical protein
LWILQEIFREDPVTLALFLEQLVTRNFIGKKEKSLTLLAIDDKAQMFFFSQT